MCVRPREVGGRGRREEGEEGIKYKGENEGEDEGQSIATDKMNTNRVGGGRYES